MLLAAVRRALERHAMIPRGTRVAVGCSGGPDSTALLLVLARLAPAMGFGVVAVSVDHRLRASAAAEIDLVGQLAQRLAVEHVCTSVDVARAVARARRTERSMQAIARTLRYRALFEVARVAGCVRVAVAHTMDDQAETVLQRILRGTGVVGLSAMRPVRSDGLVRPMLEVRRADVLAFLASRREPSALDPSNADRRYQRVRVRTDLMMRLERENPRVVEHLAALAVEATAIADDRAADAERLADACLGGSPDEGFRIDVNALSDAPEHLRAPAIALLLLRILERPVRGRWVSSLVELVGAGGHGEVPWPGWTARRTAGEAWVRVSRGVPSVRAARAAGPGSRR